MAKATATNRYPALPVFRVTSLALLFVVEQDSTGLYGDVILGFLALSTPCRHKTKNKRLFMHLLPLYCNKQKSESITRNQSTSSSRYVQVYRFLGASLSNHFFCHILASVLHRTFSFPNANLNRRRSTTNLYLSFKISMVSS